MTIKSLSHPTGSAYKWPTNNKKRYLVAFFEQFGFWMGYVKFGKLKPNWHSDLTQY